MHAIFGRSEQAVAELTSLLNAGHVFFDADLQFSGDALAELRADTAFQAFLDANNRRVAEQQARIRQLEEDRKIARYPEQLSSITMDVSSLIE